MAETAAPMGERAAEGGMAPLINRARFWLLLTCGAVSVIGIFLLTLAAASLFKIDLQQALANLPVVIAICGFTGTTQIFLNEYWMRRLVRLAHPEGVRLPAAEPVPLLLIKISFALGLVQIPLGILTLYTFNVTPFDLILLGLEDLPDYFLASTFVFIALGVGYFWFRRYIRQKETAPIATDPISLRRLTDEANSFVLSSAGTSLLLWAVAAILSSWGCHFVARYDRTLALWTLVAVIAYGVGVFPIQYFLFRRIFAPLRKALLAAAGESYRIESLSAAADSIEDEQLRRERVFTLARIGISIPMWGALVVVHEIIEPFLFLLLGVYTILLLVSLASSYVPRLRPAGAYGRLLSDGVALTLFVHYTGSITTLIVGFYFLMSYSVTLHHGFEKGLLFAALYSGLYGAVLWAEYLHLLPYAPSSEDGQALLAFLYEKTLWKHFHPSIVFLSSFIIIAGGMFGATFLARMFRRRQGSLGELMDLG
ncbi:MAG: hypothetical protein AB1405_09985 [Bdellovibrionota bacterium]